MNTDELSAKAKGLQNKAFDLASSSLQKAKEVLEEVLFNFVRSLQPRQSPPSSLEESLLLSLLIHWRQWGNLLWSCSLCKRFSLCDLSLNASGAWREQEEDTSRLSQRSDCPHDEGGSFLIAPHSPFRSKRTLRRCLTGAILRRAMVLHTFRLAVSSVTSEDIGRSLCAERHESASSGAALGCQGERRALQYSQVVGSL